MTSSTVLPHNDQLAALAASFALQASCSASSSLLYCYIVRSWLMPVPKFNLVYSNMLIRKGTANEAEGRDVDDDEIW